jgi:hypothetical protein
MNENTDNYDYNQAVGRLFTPDDLLQKMFESLMMLNKIDLGVLTPMVERNPALAKEALKMRDYIERYIKLIEKGVKDDTGSK